jgi:hypothetical protein
MIGCGGDSATAIIGGGGEACKIKPACGETAAAQTLQTWDPPARDPAVHLCRRGD